LLLILGVGDVYCENPVLAFAADRIRIDILGEREAALETYPDRFLRPRPSDMRYKWLVVRLDAIDKDELRELVFDAWRMVVPKKLASLSDDELRQLGVA